MWSRFRPVIPLRLCVGSPSCSSAGRPRRSRSRRSAAPPRRCSPSTPTTYDGGPTRVRCARSRGSARRPRRSWWRRWAGRPRRTSRTWRRALGPLAPGGAEVRAALRGDLHTHSDWSDGGSPIEEMVMTAVELGHEYVALTDHSPRLKVANGLSAARLTKQLGVLEAVNGHLAGAGQRDAGAARHRGRHPRRRGPRPDRGAARAPRRGGRVGAQQAAHGARPDDPSHARGRAQPADQRAGSLHRSARDRGAGHPPAERVRRRGGVHRVPRPRRRGGDQQQTRAAGPARRPAGAGGRDRVRVLGGLRRPRSRPAGLPRPRGRPRRRARRPPRAHRDHLAARRPPRLEPPSAPDHRVGVSCDATRRLAPHDTPTRAARHADSRGWGGRGRSGRGVVSVGLSRVRP